MNDDFTSYFLHVKHYLKDFGYRNSIKREYIIKILFDTENFLNVEEIKKILLEKYSENISMSMLYKHISLLKTVHLLQCIRDSNNNEKYKINTMHKKNFLICSICKKIVEVDSKKINELIRSTSDKYDFTLLKYNLKMYGYCKECYDEQHQS